MEPYGNFDVFRCFVVNWQAISLSLETHTLHEGLGGTVFFPKAITGEARPVEKRKEHKISSGCVILNGYVEVTLTKDHSNSTLSQIEAKAWD